MRTSASARCRAGLAYVICEKPFVSTVEEADRVLATAGRRPAGIAVNHQYREKPIFRAVKERVGAPDIGRLVFCQIVQLMNLPPWEETTPSASRHPEPDAV